MFINPCYRKKGAKTAFVQRVISTSRSEEMVRLKAIAALNLEKIPISKWRLRGLQGLCWHKAVSVQSLGGNKIQVAAPFFQNCMPHHQQKF